jgi:hypothetical protein
MCKDLIFFGGGGGGSVNTGVLQIAGGVALDSTLRFVEDQNGTDSVLKLATNKASFDTGTTLFQMESGSYNFGQNATPVFNFLTYNLAGYNEPYFDGQGFRFRSYTSIGFTITDSTTVTSNGALTVKGLGGNIASFRDSSNVQQASISNAGLLTIGTLIASGNAEFSASGYFGFSNRCLFRSGSDGVLLATNYSSNGFTRLQFGSTTTDFPAIAATNTPPALAAKDATGANLIPFSAEDFTSANLSAGTLNTARPMQFGDKGTVTTGNDLGLDAQIAVEHNGQVYYIPCSTVLLT